jgi:hypothetical protein
MTLVSGRNEWNEMLNESKSWSKSSRRAHHAPSVGELDTVGPQS